jgi:glyoxylase-like metal-dependent hydrolase (beta-lactamase superfamily II)
MNINRRMFLTLAGSAWAGWEMPRTWAAEARAGTSHGPQWLIEASNSRQLIEEQLLRAPRPRKITDEILGSSRLENVFFVDLGRHAVLIDTGFDYQVERHLVNLQTLGADLAKVAAILCTHSHVDHTGGVNKARDRLGVPVIAHPMAVEPITTGDKLRTAAVIPEVEGWEFDFPPCEVDRTVEHGDVIRIGEEEIRVLHLPGHTPDSVGYVWREQFFSGDAVFAGGAIGWASERWLSNYADHAQTMRLLLETPPPARQLHAAHGFMAPYDDEVPRASLRMLARFSQREADPCNHTPRTHRRPDGEPPKVLNLAL